MASLVLGAVGGVVGFMVGGPAGAAMGFSLGSAAGGLLFPPKGPDGPRLNDLSVQSSTYGKGIPINYGKTRIAGNIIWADKIQEHAHDEGGKGGPEYTTYSYTCSFASSICEGPIPGITRIWADGLMIYDSRPTNTGEKVGFKAGAYAIYLGTEDQLPDPTIQALIGDTPAYRGQAYVVFTDLQLEKFGNRIPSLSFEIGLGEPAVIGGVTEFPTTLEVGGDTVVYNPVTNTVWSAIDGGFGQPAGFAIYDIDTGQYIGRTASASGIIDSGAFGNPQYDPVTHSIYVMGYQPRQIFKFDASSGELLGTYANGATPVFFAVSPANGNIWYTTGGFNSYTVTELDSASGLPVWSWASPVGTGNGVGELVVDTDNTAWMAQEMTLRRSNKTTNQMEVVYNAGSTIYEIEYDPDRHSVWFANSPYDLSRAAGGHILSVQAGAVTTVTFNQELNGSQTGNEIQTGRMVHFVEGHGYPSLRGASAMATQVGTNSFSVAIDTSADVVEAFDEIQDAVVANHARLFEYGIAQQAITRAIEAENSGASRSVQIAYDSYRKVIWLNADQWGTLSGFSTADGSEWRTIRQTPPAGSTNPVDVFSLTVAPNDLWANDSSYEQIFRIRFGTPPILSGDLTLGQVVADISRRAGLDAGDIDVEELVDLVDGYTITHQMAARSALEPLMQAYFFDPVESDYKIAFRKRGRPSSFTITDEELAAHSSGSEPPDLIEIMRKQELDLPQSVSVKYINPAADYQTGTQYEARQTGRSNSAVTVDLPIVMPDEKAKAVAAAALYTAWAERTGLKFTTSLAYAKVEPTDVGLVHGRIVRVANKKRNGGLIEWECFADGNTIYPSDTITQGGAAAPSGPVGQSIPTIPATQLIAIDAPITMEGTTTPSLTFAVQGTATGFTGAQIWKSIDGGASYAPIASAPSASLIGTAANALGDWKGGDTFDEVNTVTVSLLPSSSGATLSSATEESVLNGANAALLGDEVLQYKRAVLNDDGTYTLSGLLRYRRGTDYATHAAGESFVPLTSNLVQIPVSTAEIGLPRQYKAVSNGGTLAAAQAVTLTYTGADLKPYSPVNIGGWRDAAGDLTLTWVRRTRVGGEWRDFVDVPLAEATEAYDVEILNGSTVVRTLSGVTAPTVVYSQADQVADFGSLQSAVSVRVYQLSSVVGRGFPGTGSV